MFKTEKVDDSTQAFVDEAKLLAEVDTAYEIAKSLPCGTAQLQAELTYQKLCKKYKELTGNCYWPKSLREGSKLIKELG